jgi:hypothetical protein
MVLHLIFNRAENGTRTRDPQLGKLMLYRLSYFRKKVLQRYSFQVFTV